MALDIAPSVVERAAQPYVYRTRTVTMDTIGEIADQVPVVIARLAELGVAPAGAPFLRYRTIDMGRSLHIDAGVPVATAPTGDDALDADVLPGGRYATVVHRGHPDRIAGVTAALLDWADRTGHEWDRTTGPDGERWGCRLEVFGSNPMEVPIDEWVTELAFRLRD